MMSLFFVILALIFPWPENKIKIFIAVFPYLLSVYPVLYRKNALFMEVAICRVYTLRDDNHIREAMCAIRLY